MSVNSRFAAAMAAAVAIPALAHAAVPTISQLNSTLNTSIYSDGLESGANWTLVQSANGAAALDTAAEFNFNYNAGGNWSVFTGTNAIPANRIPAAPSGTGTTGLIVRAQDVDDAGTDATQGIATRLSNVTLPSGTTQYAIRFDLWVNAVSGGGSSEFAFYGLGGSSTQTMIGSLAAGATGTGAPPPPTAGSTATAGVGPMTAGHTFTVTGDGGFARDIRYFSGTAEDITDARFVVKYGVDGNGIMTTVPMDSGNPAYATAGLFTNNTAPAVAGAPGNQWLDIILYYDGADLTYYINGVAIYTLPSTTVSLNQAFLGYMDMNSSVSLPAVQTFAVYDNFRILTIPEPTSLGLVAAAGVLALRRRK